MRCIGWLVLAGLVVWLAVDFGYKLGWWWAEVELREIERVESIMRGGR